MHIVCYLPSEGRTANRGPIFMSGKIGKSWQGNKNQEQKKQTPQRGSNNRLTKWRRKKGEGEGNGAGDGNPKNLWEGKGGGTEKVNGGWIRGRRFCVGDRPKRIGWREDGDIQDQGGGTRRGIYTSSSSTPKTSAYHSTFHFYILLLFNFL